MVSNCWMSAEFGLVPIPRGKLIVGGIGGPKNKPNAHKKVLNTAERLSLWILVSPKYIHYIFYCILILSWVQVQYINLIEYDLIAIYEPKPVLNYTHRKGWAGDII